MSVYLTAHIDSVSNEEGLITIRLQTGTLNHNPTYVAHIFTREAAEKLAQLLGAAIKEVKD